MLCIPRMQVKVNVSQRRRWIPCSCIAPIGDCVPEIPSRSSSLLLFPTSSFPPPLPIHRSHASILVASSVLSPFGSIAVIDSCSHQGKAKGCPCKKKPCLDSHMRTRISSVTIATNDRPETQRKYLFRRFFACCCSSQESLRCMC